jgi:hypothetical protein
MLDRKIKHKICSVNSSASLTVFEGINQTEHFIESDNCIVIGLLKRSAMSSSANSRKLSLTLENRVKLECGWQHNTLWNLKLASKVEKRYWTVWRYGEWGKWIISFWFRRQCSTQALYVSITVALDQNWDRKKLVLSSDSVKIIFALFFSQHDCIAHIKNVHILFNSA